jgi:hypothetical protein
MVSDSLLINCLSNFTIWLHHILNSRNSCLVLGSLDNSENIGFVLDLLAQKISDRNYVLIYSHSARQQKKFRCTTTSQNSQVHKTLPTKSTPYTYCLTSPSTLSIITSHSLRTSLIRICNTPKKYSLGVQLVVLVAISLLLGGSSHPIGFFDW